MATPILMPALSPTMTEGTIAKWLKDEGDAIQSGDLLAEIETDKATMELEAIEEGILGKIIQPEGSQGIPVNEPIAVILVEGEDASAADSVTVRDTAPKPMPSPTPTSVPDQARARKVAAPRGEAPSSDRRGRTFASPLAKRLAAEERLDLSSIIGSGPHGRIVKRDIEQSLAAGSVTDTATTQDIVPAPSLPFSDSAADPPLTPLLLLPFPFSSRSAIFRCSFAFTSASSSRARSFRARRRCSRRARRVTSVAVPAPAPAHSTFSSGAARLRGHPPASRGRIESSEGGNRARSDAPRGTWDEMG